MLADAKAAGGGRHGSQAPGCCAHLPCCPMKRAPTTWRSNSRSGFGKGAGRRLRRWSGARRQRLASRPGFQAGLTAPARHVGRSSPAASPPPPGRSCPASACGSGHGSRCRAAASVAPGRLPRSPPARTPGTPPAVAPSVAATPASMGMATSTALALGLGASCAALAAARAGRRRHGTGAAGATCERILGTANSRPGQLGSPAQRSQAPAARAASPPGTPADPHSACPSP